MYQLRKNEEQYRNIYVEHIVTYKETILVVPRMNDSSAILRNELRIERRFPQSCLLSLVLANRHNEKGTVI